MARRQVIWSLRAKNDRIKILDFWIAHNQSKAYSIKLNNLFKDATKFIAEHPSVGKLTDDKKARIKIVRDFYIVYEIRRSMIVILAIFDSRRNPDNLKI